MTHKFCRLMNYTWYMALICLTIIPFTRGATPPIVIEEPLTFNNALFPRQVYETNEKGLEVERQTVTRTLLVFLDITEFKTGGGSVTEQLVEALTQQPCPILVSHALLCTIFNSTYTRSYRGQQLLKHFKREEWIIKSAISSIFDANKAELFLLIPKSYILKKAEQERKIKTLEDLNTDKTFDLDKFSGLRLSKMGTINDTAEQWQKRFFFPSENLETYFEKLIKHKITPPGKPPKKKDALALFIPRKDYKDDTKNRLPQWNIYMVGHGDAKTEYSSPKIVGLNPDIFKKWVNLINYQIITKFFMYTSCYATGFNHQYIYNELSNGIGDTYPFPIVATGIVETAATANLIVNYKKFVELAESNNPIAYPTLLETLLNGISIFWNNKMSLTDQGVIAAFVIRNLPLLRLANRPVFLPLIPVFELTQLMANTRDPQKPLDIRTFITKNIDPQIGIPQPAKNRDFIVILDAQYIPFDIVITTEGGKNPFQILSALFAPRIMHVFDGEVFFDSTLENFFKMFQYPLYGERKIFYLHKLTLKNSKGPDSHYQDVIIFMGRTTVTTEDLSTNETEVVYTSADGKQYISAFPDFKPKVGVLHYEKKKEYSSQLTMLRKEYAKSEEIETLKALTNLNNALASLSDALVRR